jgi:hypothetical protein
MKASESAPVRVLDAVAVVAGVVRERIAELKAAGRDVSRLESSLRAVARLHSAATSSLEEGELEPSLDYADRAGELINALRRTVGR